MANRFGERGIAASYLASQVRCLNIRNLLRGKINFPVLVVVSLFPVIAPPASFTVDAKSQLGLRETHGGRRHTLHPRPSTLGSIYEVEVNAHNTVMLLVTLHLLQL